jgi:hypothetical protein
LNAAENDAEILNMKNKKEKSPIFYARTPKMVLMLSMQPDVNIYETASKVEEKQQVDFMGMGVYLSNDPKKEEMETNKTVLEALLKNNSECAKTLLSSGITTNNKEFNDRDLLFIYNLKMLTKEESNSQQVFLLKNMNKLLYMLPLGNRKRCGES